MLEHFTAPENIFFAIALGILLVLFVVEMISLLAGVNTFGFLDNLLPDFDADIDLDVDPKMQPISTPALESIFGLLGLGKVPFILTFILFLFLFSCIGYNLQYILNNVGIGYLPSWIATPIAFVGTMPILGAGNRLIAKVIPQDETQSVSSKSFIGRTATITLGEVTFDKQSEAKLEDQFNRTHYIQVVSDLKADRFQRGDLVLVVGKRGSLFTVIDITNPNLEDT